MTVNFDFKYICIEGQNSRNNEIVDMTSPELRFGSDLQAQTFVHFSLDLVFTCPEKTMKKANKSLFTKGAL